MITVVAIAIIVIALLVLAYRRPQLGFSVLAGLVAFAVFAYLFTRFFGGEDAPGLTPDHITLESPAVTTGYAKARLLTATVQNQHPQQALQSMVIASALHHCPEASSALEACQLVREQQNLVKLFVPAEQSRALSQTLRYVAKTDTPENGIARWQHQIVSVK